MHVLFLLFIVTSTLLRPIEARKRTKKTIVSGEDIASALKMLTVQIAGSSQVEAKKRTKKTVVNGGENIISALRLLTVQIAGFDRKLNGLMKWMGVTKTKVDQEVARLKANMEYYHPRVSTTSPPLMQPQPVVTSRTPRLVASNLVASNLASKLVASKLVASKVAPPTSAQLFSPTQLDANLFNQFYPPGSDVAKRHYDKKCKLDLVRLKGHLLEGTEECKDPPPQISSGEVEQENEQTASTIKDPPPLTSSSDEVEQEHERTSSTIMDKLPYPYLPLPRID